MDALPTELLVEIYLYLAAGSSTVASTLRLSQTNRLLHAVYTANQQAIWKLIFENDQLMMLAAIASRLPDVTFLEVGPEGEPHWRGEDDMAAEISEAREATWRYTLAVLGFDSSDKNAFKLAEEWPQGVPEPDFSRVVETHRLIQATCKSLMSHNKDSPLAIGTITSLSDYPILNYYVDLIHLHWTLRPCANNTLAHINRALSRNAQAVRIDPVYYHTFDILRTHPNIKAAVEVLEVMTNRTFHVHRIIAMLRKWVGSRTLYQLCAANEEEVSDKARACLAGIPMGVINVVTKSCGCPTYSTVCGSRACGNRM